MSGRDGSSRSRRQPESGKAARPLYGIVGFVHGSSSPPQSSATPPFSINNEHETISSNARLSVFLEAGRENFPMPELAGDVPVWQPTDAGRSADPTRDAFSPSYNNSTTSYRKKESAVAVAMPSWSLDSETSAVTRHNSHTPRPTTPLKGNMSLDSTGSGTNCQLKKLSTLTMAEDVVSTPVISNYLRFSDAEHMQGASGFVESDDQAFSTSLEFEIHRRQARIAQYSSQVEGPWNEFALSSDLTGSPPRNSALRGVMDAKLDVGRRASEATCAGRKHGPNDVEWCCHSAHAADHARGEIGDADWNDAW